MNIFNAYLEFALPIAIFHGALALTSFVCMLVQRIQLKKERAVYRRLKNARFEVNNNCDAEICRVAKLTLTMTRKGEIPNPEAIKTRLLGHLAKYDILIRFCLNAFIISGLLGTLFNLWKLGPSFWAGIVSGQEPSGQPAIGIAFSASVFGLGLALTFSLLDSVFVRFSREAFVQNASAALFDVAATLIPPTERAVVAEALQKFYADSEGLLKKFRTQHDELSEKFITQIQSSSDKLNGTMTAISNRWGELVQNTTTTVDNLGKKLGEAADDLNKTAASAEKVLASTVPLVVEAQDLNKTLIQIRAESARLQNQITQWTSEFSEKWRADLSQAFESHAQNIGRVYETGLSQFDKSAREWQQKNATTIDKFAAAVDESFKEWRQERQSVEGHVNALIESWQRELGQATTGIGTGLSRIREEIDKLQSASERLATTQIAATKDLQNLEAEIRAFSGKVVDGTPLGTAITALQTSISELCLQISSNGTEAPTVVPASSPDSESIQLILDELRKLSASISKRNTPPRSFTPASFKPPSNPVSEQPPNVVLTSKIRKRFFWDRIRGLWRRRST